MSDDFKANVTKTVSLEVEENVTPIFYKSTSVPVRLRDLVKKELQQLEHEGIIIKVFTSEWASPTVYVLKSENKSVRICGDYSATINKNPKLNQCPLPSVAAMISRVGNSSIFSKIDLKSAYLQLPLDDASKDYNTINTSEGLYRHNYLPFGLCSSPGIFQSFMCKILNGIQNTVIYQDDILVLTPSIAVHNVTLRKVLTALMQAGVKVNPSKCQFFTDSVAYLGHIFNKDGVHPDPKKLRAIIDAPQPTCLKQMQSFVGLYNFYSRFVDKFADVFAPLYKLLQKNVKFFWGEEQKKCFETIKELFCSSKVLRLYDSHLETLLETDASSYGIAAVLMQRENNYTPWYPVQFASRTLNKSERNYSNIEREALSVIFGCYHFRKFLLDAHFIIRNDQQPLRKLLAHDAGLPTTCSARLQLWA